METSGGALAGCKLCRIEDHEVLIACKNNIAIIELIAGLHHKFAVVNCNQSVPLRVFGIAVCMVVVFINARGGTHPKLFVVIGLYRQYVAKGQACKSGSCFYLSCMDIKDIQYIRCNAKNAVIQLHHIVQVVAGEAAVAMPLKILLFQALVAALYTNKPFPSVLTHSLL